MKIICSVLLYNTREERVNLICKEYMDTKSDHQEEYTIKAFIFNHCYYFKTATVDIMDVGVDYHFPYPVDLSLSHIWGGTEVAPHRPRDATLQIPINMGGFLQVLEAGRGFPLISTISKIHSKKSFILYPPTFLLSK